MQSSSQIVTTKKTTPSCFTGRMPFLLPNQQCQSTGGKVANCAEERFVIFVDSTVILCSCHKIWLNLHRTYNTKKSLSNGAHIVRQHPVRKKMQNARWILNLFTKDKCRVSILNWVSKKRYNVNIEKPNIMLIICNKGLYL